MGFIVENYSLFGLQPQNFYVTIRGGFTIEKNTPPAGSYRITYTVYYSSSKAQPVITQKDTFFNLQELPTPANIYTVIYGEIKKNLDPNNILTIIVDD